MSWAIFLVPFLIGILIRIMINNVQKSKGIDINKDIDRGLRSIIKNLTDFEKTTILKLDNSYLGKHVWALPYLHEMDVIEEIEDNQHRPVPQYTFTRTGALIKRYLEDRED